MPRLLDFGGPAPAPARGPAPDHFIARYDPMRQRFTVFAGEGYFSAEVEDVKGVLPSGMLWHEGPDEVNRVCTYLWNTGCITPIPGMERMPEGDIELERDIRARKVIIRIGELFVEAEYEDTDPLRSQHITLGENLVPGFVFTLVCRLWNAGVLRPHEVPAWAR